MNELWEFAKDKWGDIVAIATLALGGGYSINKHNKKIDRQISEIDQRQDYEISSLKEKVIDVEDRIDKAETVLVSIEKDLFAMHSENKHNQELIMLQLKGIASVQEEQGSLLKEWSKNIENFYYLNPNLKKPDA